MTDPWYVGAQQHREQHQQRAREAEEHQRQEAARRSAEEKAANTAQAAMEQAMAEATPLLTRFLQERGVAAQTLLAAWSSKGGYIVFGDEREGGYYFSVSLDKTGLLHEEGRKSGYETHPVKHRLASPREAVEAFAYYGPGRKDPQKVRNIVAWLTEQINTYLPR